MDVFPLCNDLESHGLLTEQSTDGQHRQNARIELLDLRGNTLDGYVYGRRSDPLSRSRIPLQGIELQGKAALREEMFTRILPHEVADVKQRYILGETGTKRDFLSGEEIEQEPILALSGARLFAFSSIANLEAVNRSAAKLEEMIGMETGSQLLLTARLTLGHDPIDLDEVEDEGEVLAITSNTKSDCHRHSRGISPTRRGLRSMPRLCRIGLMARCTIKWLRCPTTRSGLMPRLTPAFSACPSQRPTTTGNDDGQKKNGDLFNHCHCHFRCKCCRSRHDWIYAPVCDFQGNRNGILRSRDGGGETRSGCRVTGRKVIVHELGHNFTLSHASYWDATTADPVGDGNSSEYGDNTSIMGGRRCPERPTSTFRQNEKSITCPARNNRILGDADSSQVVRIYRHDHVDADITTGKRSGSSEEGG